MTFAQLTFPLDGAQATQNGSYAPPAATDDRTHADGPCGRCAALSASPTAPDTGAQCVSCRFAADHAGRRCAVCGGPIPAGRKITARYCGPECKRRRSEETRPGERDHAAGIPHERRRCQCDRPLLIVDDDLGETRCMRCGRVR